MAACSGRIVQKCKIIWNTQLLHQSTPIFSSSPLQRLPECSPSLTQLDVRLQKVRLYSQQPQRKGFLSGLLDNIKQEMAKNQEMKENIKKFREEAQKLEDSEALKAAREKYKGLESETFKSTETIKKAVGDIREKVQEGLDEVQKQDWVKKGMSIGEEVSKTAKGAAETISKTGEDLAKTRAYKTISQSVKTVAEELEETAGSGAYKAPAVLRKRTDSIAHFSTAGTKRVEANEDATGMVLHKDSKWYQQWKQFSENNQVFNKIVDLKIQYDESDNVVVRGFRAVTDRVSGLLGGVFTPTEMSEVLTEIMKVDPEFTKESFLQMCERDIIPNILEAMIQGNLEILQDWCYEAPYNQLAVPIKQAHSLGYKFDSKVLNIDSLDVSMGKMMEQGPVLVISFMAQQILAIRNGKGEVVEGDPEKVMRVTYVWVLCRDQEILDPQAAWRLLDLSANSSAQWV